MVNFFKKFYEGLGNNKGQRFYRFLLLLITAGIIFMLIFNLGFKDGKFYWKPFEVKAELKK